jgi:hypothetical protein
MSNPHSRKLRIVTNVDLDFDPEVVTLDHVRDRKRLGVRGLIAHLANADAIVWKLPSTRIALMCWVAKLRSRTRLVYYDVNIPIARGAWDRLKRRVYLQLVRRADLVLTLHSTCKP